MHSEVRISRAYVLLLCAIAFISVIVSKRPQSLQPQLRYHPNNAPIDARALSKAQTETRLALNEPLRIINPFSSSPIDHDDWADQMVTVLANEVIQYDNRIIKDDGTNEVITYEATLEEYLTIVGEESSAADSVYLMSEALLDEPYAELAAPFILNPSLFGRDLFLSLPLPARPRLALVIGGEGSRSFCHRDPFDWLGWNYLIEGRKLWLFLDVDQRPVDTRWVEPAGWGLVEQLGIAAGAVSDDSDLLERSSSLGGVTAVIQEAGELITVPAGRWHQVFHLSASIAIAGQMLSPIPSLLSLSIAHMLGWSSNKGQGMVPVDKLAARDQLLVSRTKDIKQKGLLKKGKKVQQQQEELVAEVLKRAIRLRHGEEEGERLIDIIYSEEAE